MATPNADEPQLKSKKPSNSAFKQQKLPAWQPILTAGTVLPTFFIIGLAFIPVGIGLLVSSHKVQEFQIDYTYCNNSAKKGERCADVLQSGRNETCTCILYFNITTTFEKDVYLYYGLTNYYQNHRRYVKSRDDSQLLGDLSAKLDDCQPFAYDDNTGLPIAPCGAIANSKFSDNIRLYSQFPGRPREPVPLLSDHIAWPTDKTVKFRNPPLKEGQTLKDVFINKTSKPPAWKIPVYQLDPDNPDNNGFVNEDLIVWMRTAALPTFRKLYRRINHNQTMYKSGLPKGKYVLEIDYNYNVTSFKGTKRIILSNTSFLGGKNPFLGYAYIAVGSICLVLAIIFLIIHFKFGKSTQDLVNISQRTPY